MVPSQAPSISTTTTTTTTKPAPPTLTRSTTLPAHVPQIAPNRTLLAPEDAIYQGSPPRKQSLAVKKLQHELRMTNGPNGLDGSAPPLHRGRGKSRNRSGSRKRKVKWSKLLWLKQSCKNHSLRCREHIEN
jgi:phosphatidylinositol glycan class C protein